MKIIYHHDAGHGWLEVPLATAMLVKTPLKKISGYSYVGLAGGFTPTLYLEEDCDAGVFLDAAAAAGKKVEFVHKQHGDYCFIRQLSDYPAGGIAA